jgi:predicted enzyme related to lactoylglutathione lyase
MPRVIHFEIHASDPEALMDFSSALPGWSFVKDPDGNIFGLPQPDERAA